MQAKYFFQLLALSALWGLSFIMTRIAAPAMGPNVSAGLRMVLAAITLSILMRVLKHPWPWQHWRQLVLLGFLAGFPTKLATGMIHSAGACRGCRKVREPIRHTACKTMAATAGLMPKKTPATTGK